MNENKTQTHCVACMEEIRDGARVCPHCHSPQSPQRWKGIGTLLKWIGGVTAIISLVLGVWQANKIFVDWSDRKSSVDQFLKAADFQLDLMDYPGSWQIIQECLALDAMSPKALLKEVQVAMAWVRDPMRHKGEKKYSEIVAPLMPALYRGAVLDDNRIAADALAHIGFANFLRSIGSDSKYEIDEYFRRSTQKNPRNIYAHAFWGYWILNRLNQKDYERDKLEIAMEHFDKARNSAQSSKDREFVYKRTLGALVTTYAKRADVEAIKLANELRNNNEEIEPEVKSACIALFRTLEVAQFTEGEFLDRLYKKLSPKDVLATYIWLSEGIDFEHDEPFGMPIGRHTLVRALLKEGAGHLQGALDDYRAAWSKGWKEEAERAMNRVKTALNKRNVTN